ncbi:MAG: cation-translocating P-type ATPase [Candidatus Levybacteria bacterium]|nr:cation-translocating P-type ATPase [Candidatus Levybacteria bacterium]
MEKGLTEKEAREFLLKFGRNEIVTKKPYSALSIFLSQFPTIINFILVIAAIFSLITKNNIDAFFIFTILILNSLFGFFQEYKAEKSLEKLKNFITPLSRVFRNGKETQIESSLIVCGDFVILSEGDRIPADGKILLNHSIEVDESILTGESLPVIKKLNDEVFSGTLITKGRGHLLVEKTGMNTRFGQIAKTLSTIETDKTPLSKKLNTLGKILSLGVVVISLSLIPIGMMQGKSLLPLILLATSIGVAAIPESLPAVITISLALGTNRMAKKQAIVRKMQAVETLGAVQIILTDKTGTLTQNVMRVKKYWTVGKKSLPDLLKACVFGNTASLIKKEGEEYDVVGDKTDGALLLFSKNQKVDFESLKTQGSITDEFVFDSQTKTITTVFESQGKKYVFVRGSPEIILEKSGLSDSEKKKITSEFSQYAKEGLRVIGFGTKIEEHQGMDRKHLEDNLEFLGFVGIYDPPREEVKQAILQAKKAGIKTIMVTGDNELTATAIAQEIGLIEKGQDVITGEELEKMSDEELEKIITKTAIFARTNPHHKLRLVETLKKLGFVVAVTGDGVNDALALKRADVGIAMGEEGTDVAKEASEIVLTNDNYSILIKAVEEGRIIYDNILKAITYLLSGNLSEIALVFFATVLGMQNPLLPTQILWINLITDGLPALALASDSKNPDVLKNFPRDPKSPFLSGKRLAFIGLVGIGVAFFLLLIFDILLKTHTPTYSRTVVFNLLVFIHMIIAFVVRGGSILKPNKILIFGVIGTFLLQFIITTNPFFQKIFHLGF